MIVLRSVLFALLASLVTIIYGFAVIPGSLISHKLGYACARSWGRVARRTPAGAPPRRSVSVGR